MEQGNDNQSRLIGLPIVADATTTALIVGTFPSAQSLAAQQYYANSQNGFWALMSAVHHDDYQTLGYATRIKRMLVRRIGIWDVYESCVRLGSLDKSIRDPRPVDLAKLRKVAPVLKLILFNGGKAAAEQPRFEAAGYQTIQLPSSSSAHAIAKVEKEKAWKNLIPDFFPPMPKIVPVKPLKPISREMLLQAIREDRK
jgi:hypoxanthine-DNA glycosylase